MKYPEKPRRPVQPRCPIRTGDACTLCFPGASGPADCGLVYLVRNDPELEEQWAGRAKDSAA